MHFGPVTEIDQQKWKRLSIGKAGPREEVGVAGHSSRLPAHPASPASAAGPGLKEDPVLTRQDDCRYLSAPTCRESHVRAAASC